MCGSEGTSASGPAYTTTDRKKLVYLENLNIAAKNNNSPLAI